MLPDRPRAIPQPNGRCWHGCGELRSTTTTLSGHSGQHRLLPATGHERALARLLQGLADGEGVLLLTGDPGTGKTLLCHCLAERLGEERPTIFLTNSHFAHRAALFQALLFDLSLPYEGRGEQEMRLALTDHLLKTYAKGRSTVLLVDKAHHLSADLLEELRLLGNLEARAGKALRNRARRLARVGRTTPRH